MRPLRRLLHACDVWDALFWVSNPGHWRGFIDSAHAAICDPHWVCWLSGVIVLCSGALFHDAQDLCRSPRRRIGDVVSGSGLHGVLEGGIMPERAWMHLLSVEKLPKAHVLASEARDITKCDKKLRRVGVLAGVAHGQQTA